MFSRAILRNAKFANCKAPSAQFDKAVLTGAQMGNIDLEGGSLLGAHCQGVNLERAKLQGVTAAGAILSDSNLESARLEGAELKGANLRRAILVGVGLTEADLRGADLTAAHLTNTTWHGARINSKTNFDHAVFRPGHDATNDGYDQIRVGRLPSRTNWETIRLVGKLPLFAGATTLLAVAVASATGIEWINSHKFLESITSYPIPMPPRLRWLLLSSACLAVGALVFEVACPKRVKEYSLTQWVDDLKRPGVLYVSDTIKRPFMNALAAILVILGGLATVSLFAERLFRAIQIGAVGL